MQKVKDISSCFLLVSLLIFVSGCAKTPKMDVQKGAGYALSLDGIDDYVYIADADILSGGAGKSFPMNCPIRPITPIPESLKACCDGK